MNHSIRPFGFGQRNFSEKEKEDVRAFLKNTDLLSFKEKRMLATVGNETEFFKNSGRLMAGFQYLLFCFAPVIRRQPFFLRSDVFTYSFDLLPIPSVY